MTAQPHGRPSEDLGPLLPALLDALGRGGIPIVMMSARGAELERVYTNEPMATLLGYSLDELYATDIMDTLMPDQRPLVAQLALAFRTGQPMPPALEITLLHRDGSAIPIEAASVLAPTQAGDRYVVVLRPVHQPLLAQLTLLESDRIALVGALSAGFAHEINNPLTSILLNVRTLRKHALASDIATAAVRCIDDIAIAADRIANNVRALQTLAARSAPDAIDLCAVVASALRLAAPTLETVAIVERRMADVRVVGEESRIGQAILAMLLFSGSGFDPPVGVPKNHVIVEVGARAGSAVVEVSDNGRDLATDEVRRAFDPFFRSSTRGAGVGVGLGVARAVATALGGLVSLSPRTGGGAVITMTLPIAPAAAPP